MLVGFELAVVNPEQTFGISELLLIKNRHIVMLFRWHRNSGYQFSSGENQQKPVTFIAFVPQLE
jgi:hypothetical protein